MHDQDQALAAQIRAAKDAYERDLSRLEADQSFAETVKAVDSQKTPFFEIRDLTDSTVFDRAKHVAKRDREREIRTLAEISGAVPDKLKSLRLPTAPQPTPVRAHFPRSLERPMVRSRLTGSKRCKQTRVDVSSHSPRARVAPSEVWRSNTPYPPIVAIYVQGRFRVRYAFDTTDRVYVRMDRQS